MSEPSIAEVMPRKDWIARHVAGAVKHGWTNPFIEGTQEHSEWQAALDAALRSDVLEGSEA